MKVENLVYKINSNLNSRDYFFCALCSLAFGDNRVLLSDVSKDGENVYSVGDRHLNIYYWWFAGLKDILSLSTQEEVTCYDYRLDIDNYCSMLQNKESFLALTRRAVEHRDAVTSVTSDKDYYPFNQNAFEKCFDELDEDSLNSKLVALKREYTRNTQGIWCSVLDTYPCRRILGQKIVASRVQPLNNDNDFRYLLDISVAYLKKRSVNYLSDNLYGFLTISSNIIGKEILSKSTDDLNHLVNSKLTDVSFIDRNTGKSSSVESMMSIDSELSEFLDNKSNISKEFTMPDLNKSLSNISLFNSNLSGLCSKSVNMLSLLDSEQNCDLLIEKLNNFSKKVYNSDKLQVVESKIYGTEQKSLKQGKVRGLVLSLYNSFRDVNMENILYVSHLHSKLYKDSGIKGSNRSNGFTPIRDAYYSNGYALDRYTDAIESLRDIIKTQSGIMNSRLTTISTKYHIYLYDRCSLYYDRAILPLFRADCNSELYLPVPYSKDKTHSTLDWLGMVAGAVKSLDDLKIYSERKNKPLSDMYFFAQNSNNGEKHVHEKTGGLLNIQNGKNEFADVSNVYSTGDLIKKLSPNLSKFKLKSLILAEKLEDDVTLDVLMDKINAKSNTSYDELSDCRDGLRSNMITYLNNAKIREDSLISFTDIFCDRSNRYSAFPQGLAWRNSSAFSNIDLNAMFCESSIKGKPIIESGFVRPEYFDGLFMRYNGDTVASINLQDQNAYYMNFSNMCSLQSRTPDNSANLDLARLSNFSFMKTDDFLDVEQTMYKFVLPSIIGLEDGTVVESLSLGTTHSSSKFAVSIDKYVRIGAKLAWLAFHSKLQSESKNYDLTFLCEDFNIDNVMDYSGLFSKLGYEAKSVDVIRLAKFKLRQLALLLVKNCMYATDLVELCKVFRDLVCGMLGVSDRIYTSEKKSVDKIVSDMRYDLSDGTFYGFLSSNFKDSVFGSVIKMPEIRKILSGKIEESGNPELALKLSELRFNDISETDFEVIQNQFSVLFEGWFNTESVSDVISVLNMFGIKLNGTGKVLFYQCVLDEVVRSMSNQFEEFSCDESKDAFNRLNINVSESTEVAVNKESDLSRFYGAYYVCNLLNRVYSFMCDVAHDCYQLSVVTSKENGLDFQKLTLDRCSFYITHRKSLMLKLFENYVNFRGKCNRTSDVFTPLDLEQLHTTLMLPDSTKRVLEMLDSNSVMNSFYYILSKTKNAVPNFKDYLRKVFDSNIARVKKIAYPNFGDNGISNFTLTSDAIDRINQIAENVSCVGKFKNTSIELLRSSVKDTGLYRSLRFNKGLATTNKGNLFALYAYQVGNDMSGQDLPFVYVLHESGLFFQVNLDGTNPKPLDTICSIVRKDGSEYLNSVTHKDDLVGSELFDSVTERGIGIFDPYQVSNVIKDQLSDLLIEVSKDLTESKAVGAVSASDVELLTSDKNELSVVGNGSTGLVVSNARNNLVSSVSTLNNVLSVVAGSSALPRQIIESKIQGDEVLNKDTANELVNEIIISGIDIESYAERLELTELPENQKKEIILDDYLKNSRHSIGEVFDTKMDTQRYVTDIHNMYSSIVPNTVRGG